MKNQMKKRNRHTGKIPKKRNEVLVALPIIIILAFVCGSRFGNAVGRTAVIGAGLMLPEGAVLSAKSSAVRSIEKSVSAQSSQQNAVISLPSEKNEQSESVGSNTLSVPRDIVKMMADAEKQYASANHDGTIVEKKFDASSATSTYKNITVRNTTPSHSINIESSLNGECNLDIADKSAPTVLIFHTHTTECYQLMDKGWYTRDFELRSDDPSRNMVRVGDAVSEELQKAGIGVIHDTEIHDRAYTGAYDRSRETILKIMEENPSVKIVLDVHRDAIEQSDGTRIKPTTAVNGRKAAQIMIIAGCEDGKVTSFPTWEQNLTFALKLQQTAETMYPGLMRPILFSARKYNMDVTPCSVLLEFGSDSNTIAEAEYSGHLMGKAIAEFINSNV